MSPLSEADVEEVELLLGDDVALDIYVESIAPEAAISNRWKAAEIRRTW